MGIQLGPKEIACLITIATRTRDKYLVKNKYTFIEDDIDMINENVLVSDENIEEDYERKYDNEIESNNMEKLFGNSLLSKSAGLLSNREKSALFSFSVERKTDKVIGSEINATEEATRKIRKRATEKVKSNYFKFKEENQE